MSVEKVAIKRDNLEKQTFYDLGKQDKIEKSAVLERLSGHLMR